MKIVVVEVPVGVIEGGHVARHVGCRLSLSQGGALKRLVSALQATGAELVPKPGASRGKRVENGADAVRWLLEQLTVDPATAGKR